MTNNNITLNFEFFMGRLVVRHAALHRPVGVAPLIPIVNYCQSVFAMAASPALAIAPPGTPVGRWVLLPEHKTSVPEPRVLHGADVRVAAAKAVMSTSRLAKGASAPSLPPSLQLTPNVSHVFRFVSSSSAAVVVTVANVLGALGVIGTSATSVRTVASSFRIRSLTVWPAPNSSVADTLALAWNNGTSSQVPDEHKDRTLPGGVTVTAPLRFVPPSKSLCGDWINSNASSTQLFTMVAPAESIFDFSVEYRLSLQDPGVTITVTSAVLNTQYYLALDGAASNLVVPTSAVPTTH